MQVKAKDVGMLYRQWKFGPYAVWKSVYFSQIIWAYCEAVWLHIMNVHTSSLAVVFTPVLQSNLHIISEAKIHLSEWTFWECTFLKLLLILGCKAYWDTVLGYTQEVSIFIVGLYPKFVPKMKLAGDRGVLPWDTLTEPRKTLPAALWSPAICCRTYSTCSIYSLFPVFIFRSSLHTSLLPNCLACCLWSEAAGVWCLFFLTDMMIEHISSVPTTLYTAQ